MSSQIERTKCAHFAILILLYAHDQEPTTPHPLIQFSLLPLLAFQCIHPTYYQLTHPTPSSRRGACGHHHITRWTLYNNCLRSNDWRVYFLAISFLASTKLSFFVTMVISFATSSTRSRIWVSNGSGSLLGWKNILRPLCFLLEGSNKITRQIRFAPPKYVTTWSSSSYHLSLYQFSFKICICSMHQLKFPHICYILT